LEETVAPPVKKTETNDGGPVALITLRIEGALSANVGTTSPKSGGRSVGIVRQRTKAKEFFFFLFLSLVLRTDGRA
jgi:hypothetical protein